MVLFYKGKRAAFTLVELSIVIVIIGLIIAGVTAGRSLIATSKINSQIQQLTEINVGFNTFVLQYGAIPGDMVNASSYFSGVTDGNGNGRYESTGDSSTPQSTTIEQYTIFQHLSAAKLITGSYNNTYVLGAGYPALKIDNSKGMMAGYTIGHPFPNSLQISTTQNAIKYRAVLMLNIGSPELSDGGFNDVKGIFTPAQAKAIDTKIDDGSSRKGSYKTHRLYNSATNCLTGIDGDYLLTTTTAVCFGEYILK